MGQIASVFDCAVNPLAPAPPEDHDAAEGPPKPVVLDVPRPLRDSGLWRLQRAFYESKGAAAWSEAIVPNFVTSNSFVARAYAKVALGLLRDTFEVPPRPVRAGERAAPAAGAVYPAGTDPTRPVYIVELGAGHGKLGYLVVETLLRYRSFFPRCATQSGLPFKYVLTDAFPGMVDSWRAHPSLKEFFELGAVDCAVFDAERDTSMTLAVGGETLAPGSPAVGSNPMMVIANYVFDSLTVDAFRISSSSSSGAAAGAAASAAGQPPSAPAPVLEQACLSICSNAPEDRPARDEDGRPVAAAAAGGGGAAATPSAAGGQSAAASSATATPAAPNPLSDPGLLSRMVLQWSYVPVPTAAAAAGGKPAGNSSSAVSVYGDPLLDGLLSAYLRTPSLREQQHQHAAAPAAAASATPPGGSAPASASAAADGKPPTAPPTSGASILIPLGGFRAMRSLLALSGGKLVALVGDKGYSRLAEMEGHRDPHVAVHGSVSLMVNFHALKAVAAAYGAQVMTTPYVDGFKVAALLFGSNAAGAPPAPHPSALPTRVSAGGGFPRDADDDACGAPDVGALILAEVAPRPAAAASPSSSLAALAPAPSVHVPPAGSPYPHTRWGFADGVQGPLTPEDFSGLQRCVKEEAPNPSLKHLLALLRLGNHDSEVFYKFKQAFIDKSAYPQIHDNLGRDVRGDVDRVYAGHFPLVPSKDVCFELGRMLMGLRDYGSAIDFFNKSNETCGPHHITWHNAGICFYYLEDYESALECFKASLELAPEYAEARLWWDRTAMKSSTTSTTATATSAGGGGGGSAAGSAAGGSDGAPADVGQGRGHADGSGSGGGDGGR